MIRKSGFVLLVILLGLLPFHPLASIFLETHILGNETHILLMKSWKEILCVLLIIIGSICWIIRRKEEKLDTLDYLILGFAVLSGLTGILFTGDGFPENMEQIVWGAKYGLLFFIAFFFVRRIPLYGIEKDTLFRVAIASGSVVILFGFLQKFVLPEEFLISAGYNAEYGNTEVVEGGVSYCHKIENSVTNEEFCRVQSTLSGPNQLGAYLLFLLPLLLYGFFQAKKKHTKTLLLAVLIGGFAVLMFTWSRSAWIGTMAIIAGFFIVEARRPLASIFFLFLFGMGGLSLFFPALFIEYWDELKWPSLLVSLTFFLGMCVILLKNLYTKLIPLSGGMFFIFALSGLLLTRMVADTFFWNILLRPSSTQGHWERWTDGMYYMIQNPFGLGLGDAGPASARFANPGETGFLPESWYLQVGLESGFLGLFLFVAILLFTMRTLYNAKDIRGHAMILGLMGISAASLFLHSWESAAVALSFWVLAAVVIAPEKKGKY